MGLRRNDMKTTFEILIMIMLTALGALFLVEWAAGCGETYTDANGVTHQNECVFLELKK
jgi:hypothetical protein